jgi:hypothetical protein
MQRRCRRPQCQRRCPPPRCSTAKRRCRTAAPRPGRRCTADGPVKRRRRHVLTAAAFAALFAAAVASGNVAGGARDDAQPRPFRHASHEAIPCGECHGAGAQHRTAAALTAAACAACHHNPRRELACARCHEPSSYEPPRTTLLQMTLSVSEQPRTRPVPFDHVRHGALECASCHNPAGGVFLTPPSCSSCHTEHHRGEAECSTCHVPAEPDVHDRAVHATCAGSGCHDVAAERQPALSRSMCLVCHVEQRDHEPGGLCYDCHRVPYRTD